jgi:hypothetical protein
MAKERLPRVEMYAATIPGIVGLIAAHYWLVVHSDDAGCHRFEVWQKANAGRNSAGHVHFDLMPLTAKVGGGPSKLVSTWFGDEAEKLRQALQEAPAHYPYCNTYRYWPGPNSNTFVAWVLRRAGIKHNMGWNALGKRYG